MNDNYSRRGFLAGGTAALTTAILGSGLVCQADGGVASSERQGEAVKIIAICGSPRRGKTTCESLKIALEAAKMAAPDRIQTELIELLDFDLLESERVWGSSAVKGNGSFSELEKKLSDPSVRGVLVGSPVHNSMLSVLMTAFFSQLNHTVLQGKVGGALAVGGARNGGQESVVECLNTYLFHEGVILPGTGKSGRIGALLWNQKDSVAADEPGIKLAQVLGTRVAKVALALPANVFDD